jgi:hypothetical protein
MIQAGTLVGSALKYLPQETLTESVKGKCYHIHMETQGIRPEDEVKVAKRLVDELYAKFKADVVWIRIENGIIDMQLYGSPFVWALLIAFLPTLLVLLGIVLLFASIWSVISNIPSWAWALLAVGVGMIFFAPVIGKTLGNFMATPEYSRRYSIP